jgi:KTSC domain
VHDAFFNYFYRGITLNRTPVSSSNLKAIGYDPETRTLEVEFLNGGLYSYSGVPAAIHASLMSASSHGSYFDTHVKKGGYPFKKIR